MEQERQAALASAHTTWPQLRVADRLFLDYLRDKGVALNTSANTARFADLYLACACQHGVRGALAAFEAHTRADVDAALKGARLGTAAADDVRELVRQKLFVTAPGRPAKIADYSGRGSLRGWVRAIAARTAIDLSRRHRGEVAIDDALAQALPSTGSDPELDDFKRRYAKDFKLAFQDAVKSLSEREQLLLRQYYLDGLDTPQLAKLYRVHAVTAVRWMGKLRGELAERTQRLLRQRLRINASEFRSIARLVQSQVDVSMRRVLGAPASSISRHRPREGESS